ncbi:hypothetical protein GPECTOR_34g709 [Gonium pectorale]|uniref:Amine oxidase domain-containing protein n=1 Tax=Gonium pectorale TaxID=33097 RepID=A0A150GDX3_GONPE|nr:hypothetical protein GPECTOR_34g709 [Gonium pectorale]|eukprot:KXZ47550.1 hypothetical protein GPECTOR_34g709 [Gonium pectorale]
MDCQPRTADVLVIGAGISGLSCAAVLRDAGLRVTVLESRRRIGGRLHTVTLSDGTPQPGWAVDLGGAWVHGIGSSAAPNRLFAMARQLQLSCRHTDYADAVVYTADGVKLEERAVADMEHLYHAFEEHLHSLLHSPDPRLALLPIQTVLEAFASSRNLTPHQRADLAFAVSNHIEHYWAGEAASMGVAALDEEVLPGGDVVLAEGYGTIVQHLSSGLDVRLGHEVTAVQYDGTDSGHGVAVTARRLPLAGAGTGGAAVHFTAHAAVVTLPLGVLRSGAVAFEPALARADAAKAAAIRGLGTAVYNKVIMLFDPADVFWDATTFIYRVPAPQEMGRWSYFLNLHTVTGAPVLVAFNLGEAAAALEALSDQDTVAGAMAALEGLYGPARVRRPRQAIVTRWGSDPHSRMSYTYVPAGLTTAAFDDLARPVLGRLFFAGEATHRRHYGTAHGALESGRSAAAAILQELHARQLLLRPRTLNFQQRPWRIPVCGVGMTCVAGAHAVPAAAAFGAKYGSMSAGITATGAVLALVPTDGRTAQPESAAPEAVQEEEEDMCWSRAATRKGADGLADSVEPAASSVALCSKL